MVLLQLLCHLRLFGACLGRVLAICLAGIVLCSHLKPLHTDPFGRIGQRVDRIWNEILNADPFQSCPAEGRGGDTQLNLLKNRMERARWVPTSFDQLAHLPYPQSVLNHKVNDWSKPDAAQVARYNGLPVSVGGYLARVKQGRPEPANCNSHQNVDYHLLLASSPTGTESAAIVTEATPRVRAQHAGWTLARLQILVSRHLPVRISGWTMLDPQSEGERIGPWEVHPVMQIMVQLNSTWASLDAAKL